MQITEEKLKELIKDEEMASKEYASMVSIDPHFAVLSKQEANHHKFLRKLYHKTFHKLIK
jgi:hypothetical protein